MPYDSDMEGTADVHYCIIMTGEYYRHFKGNVYRVLHITKHSETLERWSYIRRFSPISAEEAEKVISII